VLIIQAAALYFPIAFFFGPKVLPIFESTIFRAPTPLKLGIEILVFGLKMLLQGGGVLLILLLPSWIGLLLLMGRRTAEARYVDINPEGMTITSPVERLFVPAAEITGIRFRFSSRKDLLIKAGLRNIKVSGVIEAERQTEAIPLKKWVADKAPSRAELRTGALHLKQAIEDIIPQGSVHLKPADME